MSKPLLIDTCALIWLMNKSPINQAARDMIRTGANDRVVYLNPMSAWEIGMLVTKKRISLSMPVEIWFEKALSLSGFSLADLSISILIQSTRLPGGPPNDPVDRMMAALARERDMLLITRDRQLLAYGEKGYVKTLMC